MNAFVLLLGLVLIGVSYVPPCGRVFPAAVGVCFAALGWHLLMSLAN